jgi:hypothetical protein
MRLDRLMGALALLVGLSAAQQPNSANARMNIDGVEGTPYPIQMNVRTNVTSTFSIQGGNNCPFVIVASGNGNLVPGSATYFGGHYDLPLTPAYQMCLNGTQNPAFHTDFSGQYSFQVTCPPPGVAPNGIPVGYHVAYQAAVVDYFSSYGWTLTAATRATVQQGPIVVNLNTGIGYYGDSGQASVTLPTGMSLPFYGVNHSLVHISGDGYMTFSGVQVPDYTATDVEMTWGPPRIAGFWTDLDQLPGEIVRYTIDSSPPLGTTPYLLVEFINVQDAVIGNLHTFNWKIDTQGTVTIQHLPTNNPSVYDVLVGICPGNNLNPQPSRDLSTFLSPSAHLGGINESFYEWFGIISLNPYYTLLTDDPYDLAARTMNFLPSGTGSLPGSTNRYVLY